MGLKDLKAKAGFGGAKLEIRVPKKKYRRGDTVRGEVRLIGGEVTQKIWALHIYLFREWSAEYYGTDMVILQDTWLSWGYSRPEARIDAHYGIQGDRGKDEAEHLRLARHVEIRPAESKIFPFELEIPQGGGEKGVRETWKIRAQADIPRARDALAEIELGH